MKAIACIPVHLASKRLPRKILMEIAGKSLLQHTIEQVAKAARINEIWVCATTNKEDDAISEFITRYTQVKQKSWDSTDITFMRGNENDIISRLVRVANDTKANVIVNCDGEDILIDPRMIDKAVEIIELGYPFVGFRGMALGKTPIAFTTDYLNHIYKTKDTNTTEEWWKLFASEENYSIDTQEDFNRLKEMLEK